MDGTHLTIDLPAQLADLQPSASGATLVVGGENAATVQIIVRPMDFDTWSKVGTVLTVSSTPSPRWRRVETISEQSGPITYLVSEAEGVVAQIMVNGLGMQLPDALVTRLATSVDVSATAGRPIALVNDPAIELQHAELTLASPSDSTELRLLEGLQCDHTGDGASVSASRCFPDAGVTAFLYRALPSALEMIEVTNG